MTVVTTIIVAPDGAISAVTPLPAGVYSARLEVRERPTRQEPTHPFDTSELPTMDLGPWPEGMSLRREDIYGDDGR